RSGQARTVARRAGRVGQAARRRRVERQRHPRQRPQPHVAAVGAGAAVQRGLRIHLPAKGNPRGRQAAAGHAAGAPGQPPAARLQRHRRVVRPDGRGDHGRHQRGPPGRRARQAILGHVADAVRMALAGTRQQQPVVSERPAVPPAAHRRLAAGGGRGGRRAAGPAAAGRAKPVPAAHLSPFATEPFTRPCPTNPSARRRRRRPCRARSAPPRPRRTTSSISTRTARRSTSISCRWPAGRFTTTAARSAASCWRRNSSAGRTRTSRNTSTMRATP
ncbi:conserved hypothetical protein, partial [Ricinus communis]